MNIDRAAPGPALPKGYSARSATEADAPEVARIIAACQDADGDRVEMTAEELLTDWGDLDLSRDSTVVTAPDGRIAAEADIVNRRFVRISVYGYVDPAFRSLGLGSYLVGWGQAWTSDHLHLAPEGMRVVLEHYIRAANEPACRLMDAHGYPRERTVYVMSIHMRERPAGPTWPPEISVRTFAGSEDERPLFETVEDAFRDTWDRPPGTLERFTAQTHAENFDPTLWFLAEDAATGELTGFCLCRRSMSNGWITSLGVASEWRRRGIGLALLQHALGEFYGRGVLDVELSVDSESSTGAPRLYDRASMQVTQSYGVYRKTIREGRSFAAESMDQEASQTLFPPDS